MWWDAAPEAPGAHCNTRGKDDPADCDEGFALFVLFLRTVSEQEDGWFANPTASSKLSLDGPSAMSDGPGTRSYHGVVPFVLP